MFAWRDNYMGGSGGDPYWYNVVFAQNFEYPTPLQSGLTTLATFVTDASTTAAPVTINGSPTLSTTFTPFTAGTGGSVKFGSSVSNGYLSLPTNTTAYNIASGVNFTVECWFYLLSTPTGTGLVTALYPSVITFSLGFSSATLGDGGSNLFFGFYTGSWTGIQSGSTPTLNTWHHVAACRVGSTVTLYLDGTSVASSASMGGAYPANDGLYIGRRWDAAAGQVYFDGYITNVRYVIGTAVYTGNFTPSTNLLTVTQSANVNGNPSAAITSGQTRLLNMNTTASGSRTGVALTNNSTFAGTDLSTNNFTPTGSANWSGLSPFGNSYPGSFNLVSASSQSLTVATNAVFTYGTGDFTMECWVYFNSIGSQQYIIDQRNSGTATAIIPTIYLDSTNVFVYYVNGSARITGTVSIITNTWYAISIVKSSGSTKLYVNGTQDGSTYTDSNNYAASRVVIGSNGATAGNYLNGYISNIRLVKGTAVYSANYTPSSIPLTAITNTSLLLTNVGGFQDVSIQGQLISTVGTYPQLSASVAKYGSQSSVYTPSSAQYIANQTYLPFGTNDFTIECYVYLNATAILQTIMSKGTGTTGWVLQINSSNQLVWISGTSTLRTSTFTFSISNWTNIAIVRSGTTGYMFINGSQQAATYTDTSNYNQLNSLLIGTDRNIVNGLNGYLDDIRITNGIARYTTSYTPSTTTFPTYGSGNLPTPSTPPSIPAFVTSGVSFYVDAGNTASYSGSGTSWLDLSGNNWTGTITSCTYTPNGVSSYFTFNGSTSLVNFGNVTNANFGTSDFTITFWMYASVWSGGSYGPLNKKTSDVDPGWHMYSDGGIPTLLNGRFGSTTNNQCTTAVSTNAWTMYTVIRSGSGAGNLKWYVNGSSTAAGTYTNTNNITNSQTLYVGYNQQYNAYLTGRMSVIAIYNRALSTTENTQNYNATSYRYV